MNFAGFAWEAEASVLRLTEAEPGQPPGAGVVHLPLELLELDPSRGESASAVGAPASSSTSASNTFVMHVSGLSERRVMPGRSNGAGTRGVVGPDRAGVAFDEVVHREATVAGVVRSREVGYRLFSGSGRGGAR